MMLGDQYMEPPVDVMAFIDKQLIMVEQQQWPEWEQQADQPAVHD